MPGDQWHGVLLLRQRDQQADDELLGQRGVPPAVTINAGVTRGDYTLPVDPLAHFGIVYFDDIRAATTTGNPLLTSGNAVTMVDQNGATLASPVVLNNNAFKAVCA